MKKNEKKINITENTNYTGNVEITVIDKGKVREKIVAHNTGTLNICEYLRDALAGDYVIAARPGTIVPCRGDQQSLEDVGKGTPLFNDLPKKTYGDNYCSCELSFLIPSTILSSAQKIAGFRLYSKYREGYDKKLYAEVNLLQNGLNEIEVSSGTNLKVSWTLTVRLV